MSPAESKNVIVALDVPTFEEAQTLIDDLSEVLSIFKVGSQLFTACGPVAVRHILAKQREVFLDLKFHDIPNTVASAVKSVVRLGQPSHDPLDENKEKVDPTPGVLLCTLHCAGGEEMLRAASAAAFQESETIGVRRPKLVGITVLTSEAKTDNITDLIRERATLAKKCGLDGVVASSQEASMIRQEMGDDFIIVTPGIRPEGSDKGDQKRVATPAAAISAGSNYLVVGRPIIQATSPKKAAADILKEISDLN